MTASLGWAHWSEPECCGSVFENSLCVSEDGGMSILLSALRNIRGVHTVVMSGALIPVHSLPVPPNSSNLSAVVVTVGSGSGTSCV